MENLAREYFDRIETIFSQMEGLKDVVRLLLEEILEFRAESLTKEELKLKYVATQAMINVIFDLLCYQTEETRGFINEAINNK